MDAFVNVEGGDPDKMGAMLVMVQKSPYYREEPTHDPRILLLGASRTRPTKIFTHSIVFPPPPLEIDFFGIDYGENAYVGMKYSKDSILLFLESDVRDIFSMPFESDIDKHIVVIPVLNIRSDGFEYRYDAMMRGSDVVRMCNRNAPRERTTRAGTMVQSWITPVLQGLERDMSTPLLDFRTDHYTFEL